MADNTNKVTIDVEWFDELRRCENEVAGRREADCVNCHIAKDRDELKAKLEDAMEHYCKNATGELGNACKVAAKCIENERRLAEAERCVEDIEKLIDCDDAENTVGKIIRAWREKLEAK